MAEIATRPRILNIIEAEETPPGLPRNISTFTAITFALACVGLASSGMLAYFSFQGIFPGANLVVILGIGIVLSLIHGYTFSMMGTIAPRSAADYVISSRVLGGPISFAGSWGVMVTGAFLAGSALAFLSDSILPAMLMNIGMLVGANGMLAVAGAIAQPENVVLVGSALAVIVFGLAILPSRYLQLITKVSFFAGIGAWLVILAQLALPSLSFSQGWDKLMGAQSFTERVELATGLGMQIQPQSEWLVYGGILIGFSIFFGNWISTYLAGEVKKPERTILASSWASTLIAGVFFIGSAVLLQKLAPVDWFSAESYLAQADGFTGLTMPWVFFYSTVVAPNIAASTFIFLSFTLLIVNLVQMQYQYSSRIILAWADDELVPAVVGTVHPTLKSPIIALLIVAIISLFSLLMSGLTGAVQNPIENIFLLAVFQLPPVLAITVLPFLRPSWFAAAPKIARIKIGPIPLVSLTGLVTLIYLIAVTAVPFFAPIGTGFGIEALVLFVIILSSGLLWFVFYRKHQLQRNVQVDEHFKTLA